MKKERKHTKSLIHAIIAFVKTYYFLLIIAGCICFVGLISVYRLYIQKPTYIYVRIKVGQGYWWANTQRPSLWYVKAIQSAKAEKNISGESIAKIMNVSYYPWYGSSQFDIYVTLQLKVSKVGNKGIYNFKRESIGVGTPLDLEFPNVQFSGTIIALSEKPLKQNLKDKTIYLTKKYTYPWEYDAIQVGDYFNDGNGKVIEILDKGKGETNEVYLNEIAKFVNTDSETYRYIFLKAKIRVRDDGGILLYGEEIVASPGRTIGFVTNRFTFNDYVISKIE